MAYKTGTVWTFKPRGSRFEISLMINRTHSYIYDGDDENGETQAKLDSGEYVAFSSLVTVELDGNPIASDYLGGSVYARESVSDFWTDHRSADPMNRNCSIMRAKRCENCAIGHYFPDMVKAAIQEAREHIRNMPSVPYIRENAA